MRRRPSSVRACSITRCAASLTKPLPEGRAVNESRCVKARASIGCADGLSPVPRTDKYLTSSALEAAVNCALALERPLLVRGEPGTGKTQLAEAIAGGLGLRLIHWPVKSTTRAQDGLYVYDTVQRLYDSRFGDGDVRTSAATSNTARWGRRLPREIGWCF